MSHVRGEPEWEQAGMTISLSAHCITSSSVPHLVTLNRWAGVCSQGKWTPAGIKILFSLSDIPLPSCTHLHLLCSCEAQPSCSTCLVPLLLCCDSSLPLLSPPFSGVVWLFPPIDLSQWILRMLVVSANKTIYRRVLLQPHYLCVSACAHSSVVCVCVCYRGCFFHSQLVFLEELSVFIFSLDTYFFTVLTLNLIP